MSLGQSLESIGDNAFEQCVKLKSITIPDSVSKIGQYAFRNCSNLQGVELPDTLQEIADYLFYNCTKLEAISLPGSLQTIGSYAFYGCAITSLALPETLTSIGSYAFQNCDDLEYVYIPDTVTNIENYAFEHTCYCQAESRPANWSTYWNSSGTSYWGCILEDDFIYSIVNEDDGSSTLRLLSYVGQETDIVIPSTIKVGEESLTVTAIYDKAFYNSLVVSVTLPETILSIGEEAFYNCHSLTTINLPSSLESIGRYAFFSCGALTSIFIPASVTSIGTYAFIYCSSLSIRCEAQSRPAGWSSSWNYSDRPVEWGVSESPDSETVA